VWPGQYISDAALEGCIKLARQAIGDNGRAQRLIQTRRGYGYRFVGAVEEQAVGAAPGRPEPALPLGASEIAPAGVEEAVPRLPVTGVADGERKLVTLLGCALAHTEALRTRLGLDAWHSRMRTLYALAQREIQQYGGTLHHVMGDRLLAVFGAPLAHEDHARRAVLAALGILHRLAARREMREEAGGESLPVCMGLHTGLLVIGGLGEAQEQGTAIVGDLTLTVEALQTHAEPGTLLCSDPGSRGSGCERGFFAPTGL
jgi:class 3 adenylate cyclase